MHHSPFKLAVFLLFLSTSWANHHVTEFEHIELIKEPFSNNVFGRFEVFVNIFIRSLSLINQESMDYVADLYLQLQWKESSLIRNHTAKFFSTNDRKKIQNVWKPDIIFMNSKDSDFQYVTMPNVLMRIDPATGNVLYVLRLKIRFDCMMEFYKYPMDTQYCAIELSTFSKNIDEMLLRWSTNYTQPNAVTIYKQIQSNQFQVAQVKTSHCKVIYSYGQYSCLRAVLVLKREWGYHLVQSYLTTTMIVVISWISFWLDINASPARVTLGVTTLLTMSSKGIGIESNLPPVTYLKAIDVWICFCNIFVFAALIEFAVANYMWRIDIEIAKPNHQPMSTFSGKPRESESSFGHDPLQPHWKMLLRKLSFVVTWMPNCSRGEMLDEISRWLFPLLFFTFIIVYWTYYLII